MPKATAVWLVENTALSFDQIADFCKLHPLEVKAIADGDAAQGIKGLDPILTGQLTREEIDEGRGRPGASSLQLADAEGARCRATTSSKKGPRYTPVSRRQDRPERDPVAGAQPSRAQGRADHAAGRHHQVDHRRRSATAPTGTRPSLQPMDPVTLGLCSQIDLDFEVQRAAKEKPVPADSRRDAAAGLRNHRAARKPRRRRAAEPKPKAGDELDVGAVFAKLKQLGGGKKADDEDEG